jgi:hypothetical protein
VIREVAMDGFVSVPVPVAHVTKVYAFLAKLSANEDGEDKDLGAPHAPFSGWSEDELRAIHECPQKSVQRVATVLDILAKSPGQPVSYTQLTQELKVTRAELQGSLAGFTRWIHKVWGDNDGWPMTITYGESTTEEIASEGFYLMTPTTAKRWLAVRQA